MASTLYTYLLRGVVDVWMYTKRRIVRHCYSPIYHLKIVLDEYL